MNPVLILTHNCLDLTKRCVQSVREQSVPTEIVIIDNGSTDGSREWIIENIKLSLLLGFNEGVSKGWNIGITAALTLDDYVLVLNNDTVIPPWFYHELLSYNEPFVSGVSVDQMSQIDSLPPRTPLANHPDFSAVLIRRECWVRVGPFDEKMKFYASDNDFHARAHQAGVKLWKANVPFYHERSSTLIHASAEERLEIQRQADADRATFRAKWGCSPWELTYEELFK